MLAALVFIGIVVAAMVKNTGAQSAASLGYGSAMVMSSTVNSGIVATEGFLRSDASTPNGEKALEKLQAYIDYINGKDGSSPEAQFIFGNQRKMLAKDQYFRSKILSFDFESKLAKFEIESAKTMNGKTLKKALAFYLVGADITPPEAEVAWTGGNTMALNMEMEYASGNIHVKGHSTFMEKFSLGSSGATFTFEKDDITNTGSVFFNKTTSILKNVEFNVPAFFNDNALLENYTSSTMFHDNVGFNRHISTNNYTGGSNGGAIGVAGNVWVKDGFLTLDYGKGQIKDNNQGVSTKFIGTSTQSSNLFYTDNFPITGYPKCVDNPTQAPNTKEEYFKWECNNNTTNLSLFTKMITTESTNKSNFTTAYILSQLGPSFATAAAAAQGKSGPQAGEAAAQSRIAPEPTLDPTNLTKSKDDGGQDKVFLEIKNLEPKKVGGDGSLSGITIDDVKRWYMDFPETDPANKKYYSNGHLLVRIDAKVSFTETTEKFNNQIAFVLEGPEANMSGKYFDSNMEPGTNASTLIYLGKGGRLNEFGTKNDFRGLIYMDESGGSQNSQSTFNWGPNSKIEGAVILKGKGRINWNGGNVTIRKNDAVLNGYTGFLPKVECETCEGGETITYQQGKTYIDLKPLGYYYNLK